VRHPKHLRRKGTERGRNFIRVFTCFTPHFVCRENIIDHNVCDVAERFGQAAGELLRGRAPEERRRLRDVARLLEHFVLPQILAMSFLSLHPTKAGLLVYSKPPNSSN
jgi:hypothetical protein